MKEHGPAVTHRGEPRSVNLCVSRVHYTVTLYAIEIPRFAGRIRPLAVIGYGDRHEIPSIEKAEPIEGSA